MGCPVDSTVHDVGTAQNHGKNLQIPIKRISTGSFKFPGQQDSTIEVLGRFQWHLIPVLNPDGYALTWLNETVLFVHGWIP